MDALRVRNLSYSYPGERKKTLQDISFTARDGEVLGIVGPSGCGKSTLLLALAGLIPHSLSGKLSGSVLLCGQETGELSMAEISQKVQILFQSPESQLFALNVEDEITFGPENLALPWNEIVRRRDRSLARIGIERLRHRSIEELSSGQKQKVALAAVLAMEPAILLFDEPTANLDVPSIEALAETIGELRKKHTVIVIEHNIGFLIEVSDRVALMNGGRLLKIAAPEEIVRSKEYLRVMLPPSDRNRTIKKLRKRQSSTKNPPLLETERLSFSYPNMKGVLQDISLTVGKGDFLGILGLNGSGKSTLALNLIGLLKGRGKISFGGEDISGQDVYERTRKIGYVFQNPDYQLFEETLFDEIAFGPKNLRLSEKEIGRRVREALAITGLGEYRKRDPHALSVGQKRRVSIASILAMKPDILIIDEPDTGLDAKTARQVMDHIRMMNEQGMTVVMISHNLDLMAEYCSRIVGMKAGRIVDPAEVYEVYL